MNQLPHFVGRSQMDGLLILAQCAGAALETPFPRCPEILFPMQTLEFGVTRFTQFTRITTSL